MNNDALNFHFYISFFPDDINPKAILPPNNALSRLADRLRVGRQISSLKVTTKVYLLTNFTPFTHADNYSFHF